LEHLRHCLYRARQRVGEYACNKEFLMKQLCFVAMVILTNTPLVCSSQYHDWMLEAASSAAGQMTSNFSSTGRMVLSSNKSELLKFITQERCIPFDASLTQRATFFCDNMELVFDIAISSFFAGFVTYVILDLLLLTRSAQARNPRMRPARDLAILCASLGTSIAMLVLGVLSTLDLSLLPTCE
jgi:hypothetical protein